jgi:EAL domain-containing protein (putative c-di-GMP-specific phosphodiesterase class I)
LNDINEENIIVELRQIIENERVSPHFQPIYYTHPFKLMGFEVLTRIQADGVLSSPEFLFRAALKYGLYTEIELLAWSKALDYISTHLKDQTIFLNCNPYLIEGTQFLLIKSIFDKQKINPDKVILEITERSKISNYKVFYNQLRRYRDYGFRFAVDDVGGGFASLESIVETRPEVVKIDRQIVSNIERDGFKASIIKFVVAFCKENDILCVAEGIESKEQLKILLELGVDAVQGYYLHKPTPEIDLHQVINQTLIR